MIRELKILLTAMDSYLFGHLHAYVSEANTQLMLWLSVLGSHFFLLPANILLITWLLVVRKDRVRGLTVLVVELGSVLLLFLLKYYFRRVRPLHPVHEAASGYSFPSGHAMSALTFYGLIIYLFVAAIPNKALKLLLAVVLCLLILAIGLSRVYLRVHYASDVLGGFLFGGLWLASSLRILQYMFKKRHYENLR